MPKLYLHERAERDLLEHAAYLAENGGMTLAEKFLNQSWESFEALLLHPSVGAPIASRHKALANIRKWRVKGFDNHLIFYVAERSSISIVRVLYASRDWLALLDS